MKPKDTPLEPFVCWCNDRFDHEHGMRRHQDQWCPVTRKVRKREEDKEFEANRQKELAARDAALKAWKKEKARGPM